MAKQQSIKVELASVPDADPKNIKVKVMVEGIDIDAGVGQVIQGISFEISWDEYLKWLGNYRPSSASLHSAYQTYHLAATPTLAQRQQVKQDADNMFGQQAGRP